MVPIRRAAGGGTIIEVTNLDNIGPGRPTGNENEWSIVEGSERHHSNSPTFTPSGVNESSAFKAYDEVLDRAGAMAITELDFQASIG